MDKKLIELEHFFMVDSRIKKEMYLCAPEINNGVLNDDYIAKYTNQLEDTLKYIIMELKCITSQIFGDTNNRFLNRVEELEKEIKNEFYSCGLDMDKLRRFYQNRISNMNEDFINKVKENCVGYKIFSVPPVNEASSINEMLHVIHSSIINNENILQSIPVIGKRINNENYPICLRGQYSDTFNKLFVDFPLDIKLSWTDMICINDNKMIMMVRDRGHALSVEITTDNDKATIEYFIPKICNIDMVNALPGINPINANSIGATGKIVVPLNELSNSLYSIISNVPTDLDMVRDNSPKM